MNNNIQPVDIDNLLDCAGATGRRHRAEACQRDTLTGRLKRLRRDGNIVFAACLILLFVTPAIFLERQHMSSKLSEGMNCKYILTSKNTTAVQVYALAASTLNTLVL